MTSETWGVVGHRIDNPGYQGVTALTAVTFDAMPEVQFASSVWLPARSRRVVIQPVRSPVIGEERETVEITSYLEVSGDDQRPAQPAPGRVRQPGLLRAVHDRPVLGVITDRDTARDDAVAAASAMRLSAGLGRRLLYLHQADIAVQPSALSGLDALVLTHRDPGLDSGQLLALRRWLVDGGRLWIMLDRVDPAWCARLLQDDWTLAVIDRLPMTELALVGDRAVLNLERDYPVEMVRVVGDGYETLSEVNGWPAALRRTIGRGQVLVTTLEASAWVDRRNDDLPIATTPLADLAGWFLREVVDRDARSAQLSGIVSNQIGYRVLSRSPASLILLSLPVGILVAGLLLRRARKMEAVSIVAMALAVVFAVTLLALGMHQRGTVPVTDSRAQIVQLATGQDLASVSGLLAIYSPKAGEFELRSTGGGVAWPDPTGLGGKLVRMRWTDVDEWVWEGISLPSGSVRTFTTSGTVTARQRAEALLRFEAAGAEGAVEPGEFQVFEDPVLATPDGALSPRFTGPESFVIAGDHILPTPALLHGVTLTDVQQLRQSVYHQLIDDTSFPVEPVMLGWTEGLGAGIELTVSAEQRRTAMAVLPLTIEAAEPGQTVSVPAAFIPFDVVRGPDNTGLVAVYDRTTGQWVGDVVQSGTVFLRFQLPEQVRPISIKKATLELDMEVVGRDVSIVYYDGEAIRTLESVPQLIGRQRFTFSGDSAPAPDGKGCLVLGVRVGKQQTSGAPIPWRVSAVGLTVTGVVHGAAEMTHGVEP